MICLKRQFSGKSRHESHTMIQQSGKYEVYVTAMSSHASHYLCMLLLLTADALQRAFMQGLPHIYIYICPCLVYEGLHLILSIKGSSILSVKQTEDRCDTHASLFGECGELRLYLLVVLL